MSTCGRCYGLIMETGKPYGWAGKVCNCNSFQPRVSLYPQPMPTDVQREQLRQALEIMKGASMKTEVCKCCGGIFDPDEMEYGFCPNCPTVQENVLDAAVIALEIPLRNLSELNAE